MDLETINQNKIVNDFWPIMKFSDIVLYIMTCYRKLFTAVMQALIFVIIIRKLVVQNKLNLLLKIFL